VGLGETWSRGEAPGAELELDGSMGKDDGSPGVGKSSTVDFQLALADNDNKAGDKTCFPLLPFPSPAELEHTASQRCSRWRFTHLHLPRVWVPTYCISLFHSLPSGTKQLQSLSQKSG